MSEVNYRKHQTYYSKLHCTIEKPLFTTHILYIYIYLYFARIGSHRQTNIAN